MGLCVNFEKSVLRPTSDIVFIGVVLDLIKCSARVKSEVVVPLRDALWQCSQGWPFTWIRRLAGFVNFVRLLFKLPLELVSAVRDGDGEACVAALPYVTEGVVWPFSDALAWTCLHETVVYVDATPECIGIVRPGCAPVSVPLPETTLIYQAEYLAAVVAVLLMSASEAPFTVFTDNMGVYYNLDKCRCPRLWLPIMLDIFQKRNFSVAYVPSNCNPVDTPSRVLYR